MGEMAGRGVCRKYVEHSPEDAFPRRWGIPAARLRFIKISGMTTIVTQGCATCRIGDDWRGTGDVVYNRERVRNRAGDAAYDLDSGRMINRGLGGLDGSTW
jgi:hypothetical protein